MLPREVVDSSIGLVRLISRTNFRDDFALTLPMPEDEALGFLIGEPL
jgi:hypothetical protein